MLSIKRSKSCLRVGEVSDDLCICIGFRTSGQSCERKVECPFRVQRHSAVSFHQIEIQQGAQELRLTDVLVLDLIAQSAGLHLIDQRVGPVDTEIRACPHEVKELGTLVPCK